LEIFFLIHDPTSLNQQGNDVGTQYRSVIFYHNPAQKKTVEEYIKILKSPGYYTKKVITEISPFTAFYKAEDYHINYYNLNSQQPYCVYVINPKLNKFQKVFKDKIKCKEPLN
jgi:peptide-methionine (S)-S-oxide reductase